MPEDLDVRWISELERPPTLLGMGVGLGPFSKSRYRSGTVLVTKGMGFYNPSNTALENRGMVHPYPRYSTASQKGCLFLERMHVFHSIFSNSQEQ